MGRRPSGYDGSLAAIEADLKQRIGLIRKLGKKRAVLQKKLAAIDSALASAGARTGGGKVSARSANPGGLAEALVKVLKGKTMGVTEAAEAAVAAGYRTNADNFRTIVNACLIKHRSMFKKVSRGKYTAA